MTKKQYYTGIGSRKIEPEYFEILKAYSATLGKMGYILRSGGADGADTACEQGCDLVNGKKEIFLPWKKFNKNKSPLYKQSKEARDMAEKFHPVWNTLSDSVKTIMSRNSHQVMGQDMQTPSDFIMCYTLDGLEVGGTSQALRIAKAHNIPIYNVFTEQGRFGLDNFINLCNL